jgi:hypothetical protein
LAIYLKFKQANKEQYLHTNAYYDSIIRNFDRENFKVTVLFINKDARGFHADLLEAALDFSKSAKRVYLLRTKETGHES